VDILVPPNRFFREILESPGFEQTSASRRIFTTLIIITAGGRSVKRENGDFLIYNRYSLIFSLKCSISLCFSSSVFLFHWKEKAGKTIDFY